MKAELLMMVMAGVVLSLFLIVGEIAALRKRAKAVYARHRAYFRSGRYFRLLLELVVLAVFFLVQPVLIGLLVALALDELNPEFSGTVFQQVWHAF